MALKHFRCRNPKCADGQTAFTFIAEQPVCPQCKTEAKDKDFGHLIERLPFIHFDPPTHVPGIGRHHRACTPQVGIQVQTVQGIPSPWHAGTGNPHAVNCPACKQTQAWLDAVRAEEEDDTALRAALANLDKSKVLVPEA